uniref:NmrA-like domain-containing protein n=1 Tax=Bionectria ochroleuca TaxID=29856 RepID=A0A8H7N8S3_BIOOC
MSTYLVTQATGRQSQWTIRHLLAAGANVHAVVRNPETLPAILNEANVIVFKGESTDSEAIFKAAQGCKGAFLNTFPYPPGIEAQQATSVVEACKKAGVETIVASTTFDTGDKALWDNTVTKEIGLHGYYQSKALVEDIVRGAGFQAYTILRPSFIHFDYLLPSVYMNYPTLPVDGILVHSLNDGVPIAHTDAYDVGKYAAAALQDPEKFGGEEIDLANEFLTPAESGEILKKVSGKDIQARKRTELEMEEASNNVGLHKFHAWINTRDLKHGPERTKAVQAKFSIPLNSLESALQREKAALLECLANVKQA